MMRPGLPLSALLGLAVGCSPGGTPSTQSGSSSGALAESGASGSDDGAVPGPGEGGSSSGPGHASGSGSARPDAAATGITDAGDGGAGMGAPVDAGEYPPFVDAGPCPATALFCDDFEEYTFMPVAGQLDLSEMAPNWAQYSFHGYPRADNVKAFLGKQAAHFDTESGSYRFAAFVHETPDGVPAVPLAHYGRVMVFLNAVSPATQWTILEAQGLLPGSTTELATYGFGGNKGHLAASYSQRPRVLSGDGGVALRAGGPQNAAENAMAKVDCTKTATTETFPTNRWACVEWNIDAQKGLMHLWIDGLAQPEVDVAGQGTECATGTPTTPWQAPSVFTKLDLTWEGYGSDSPGQQSFFDEFAIGEQRIGCPP